MKTIKQTNILFFFDGVQVFEGRDAIGGHYLAALIENEKYAVTGVDPAMLRDFKAGALDLRRLFVERAESFWYLGTRVDEGIFSLEVQDNDILDADVLPDAGFVLYPNSTNLEALQEARARNNLVFELAVEPPEAVYQHRIHAETLGRLLTLVQGMVKHAYNAALRTLNDQARSGIERSNAHILDVVVPAAAGSFRVVLEASQQPDLLGSNEVARAFDKIDKLVSASGDPALTLSRIKEERGHFAGSYIKLLQFLGQTRTGIKYDWATPCFEAPKSGHIAEAEVAPLIEILSSINNLGVEVVTLSGLFDKVDAGHDSWRLIDEPSGKEFSGKRKESGPSLSGLTIKSKRYRITCEETIEEAQGTGREMRTLYLTDIQEL